MINRRLAYGFGAWCSFLWLVVVLINQSWSWVLPAFAACLWFERESTHDP